MLAITDVLRTRPLTPLTSCRTYAIDLGGVLQKMCQRQQHGLPLPKIHHYNHCPYKGKDGRYQISTDCLYMS